MCADASAVFLNYYSALVAGRDFKHEWTKDGVLPNAAGGSRKANKPPAGPGSRAIVFERTKCGCNWQ